jgi:hypothetical protein
MLSSLMSDNIPAFERESMTHVPHAYTTFHHSMRSASLISVITLIYLLADFNLLLSLFSLSFLPISRFLSLPLSPPLIYPLALQSFANQKLSGPLSTLVALLNILCTGALDAYLAFYGESHCINVVTTSLWCCSICIVKDGTVCVLKNCYCTSSYV